MTADIVAVEYDSVDYCSNRFEYQAELLSETVALIRLRLEDLEHDGWQGHGASAFFAEMFDEVLPALYRLIDAMHEASTTTKQIGEIMRIAEISAASHIRQAHPREES